MPSAVAEGRTVAMGTTARSWRLITASRLQRSPVYAGQSIILWWCFIRHPSPHEAGGGTNSVPEYAKGE